MLLHLLMAEKAVLKKRKKPLKQIEQELWLLEAPEVSYYHARLQIKHSIRPFVVGDEFLLGESPGCEYWHVEIQFSPVIVHSAPSLGFFPCRATGKRGEVRQTYVVQAAIHDEFSSGRQGLPRLTKKPGDEEPFGHETCITGNFNCTPDLIDVQVFFHEIQDARV